MSKRLLSRDEFTGITEWFEPTDDGFNVISEQDPTAIIEMNKAKQNAGRAYYAADPDMWRVASIPVHVQYKWALDHGIDDITKPEHWPRIRALLNSSDWRYLKTAEIII